MTTTERKERRGFASMSAEKQREIASKGGRARTRKGRLTSGPLTRHGMPDARAGRLAEADGGGSWYPSDAAPTDTVTDGAAENRAE